MELANPVQIKDTSPPKNGAVINDFCITFSTINGSGSATANTTLLRAIFKMGVPVSGKNILPSNIQGLPTWYTLRVSKDGYLGRLEKDDIVVSMNPITFSKEQEYIVPGGVLLYSDEIKLHIRREDIHVYPMPVNNILNTVGIPAKLRDYTANMVYVGILAELLGIKMKNVVQALEFHFKGKESAIKPNLDVINLAAKWAQDNLKKSDPYFIRSMDANVNCIISDGNTAAGLGAIYGGVQFVGWYPITPATSLAETMHEYVPILRKDQKEEGKETCVMIQAEDEIAAIGMAIGAGWGGLRAMTATSGPGLSLMAEYLGLAYYTETPVVVWDVQRVGPSTGLPTRTAQGDITFANFIGHGDTQYILLFPGSVKECFEFGWRAFDLAERMQTPVIVLSDLDLGMNQWISEPFEYPDQPMDRGKVLWEDDLEKILEKTGEKWGRYLDIDGDGIPYRTLPGNQNPRSAYFSRGTGHDEYGAYREDPEVWERTLSRLKLKFETAKKFTPKPILREMARAKIGILSVGSTDFSIQEARDQLAEQGIATNHMRIRAIPFDDEIRKFIEAHDIVFVVEINRDGQLKQLLTIQFPEQATKLKMVARIDGLPLSANWIEEQISAKEASK
ncbi:MAG: 2-oxoacid:acceptor oxidoreductase subunit alpha [Anaerolineaceae bacterium]|nr:2-oxoacid:acceptor oxidoreductase subunit alpha [Anaerolineaceae bacterium]